MFVVMSTVKSNKGCHFQNSTVAGVIFGNYLILGLQLVSAVYHIWF